RQAKLGDKAQTKVDRTQWKAFFGVCEVFRELVTKLESGSIIDAARESGGSENGAAPSQIDFKIDFELALRRIFDEHKRREFYLWLFLNKEQDAEKYAALGQEFLKC